MPCPLVAQDLRALAQRHATTQSNLPVVNRQSEKGSFPLLLAIDLLITDQRDNLVWGLIVNVKSVIAPGIIFAAGSMAGTANAATTVNMDIAPSVGGTEITLAGGVAPLGAAQFVFDGGPFGETLKAEIRATNDDLSAGVFYQGSSTTLAMPDDAGFANRSAKTPEGDGDGDGNYALRFSANNTTYTGYATVINGGALIDSITYEAANAVPAVPEPATWAMMILGMGLVGSELRRRRRQTRSVALAA